MNDFAATLERALPRIQQKYPGIGLQRSGTAWKVVVPASCHVGHEAHFGQVTEQFLAYVKSGSLPPWEVPNMLAKYFTTTRALEIARRQTWQHERVTKCGFRTRAAADAEG